MIKSESISHHLMKVYGAMLWSLVRIITTPKVTKVYIGRFWSQQLQNPETAALIQKEIPKMGVIRNVIGMVKRIRLVRVQALLLDYSRGEMPGRFGKEARRNC